MLRLAWIGLALGACGFHVGASGVDAGDDAPGGTPSDAIDAMVGTPGDVCYGTLVRVCFDAPPATPLALPTIPNPFDTSVNANCTLVYAQTDGQEVCVLAGSTITVNSAFIAIGSRPLVLVAATSITVSNVLDVSSTITRTGAGSQALACTTSGSGANDRGGGGGGAGGSFATIGGTGGVGDTNQNGPPTGMAPGGNPGATQPTPTLLRGGCRGGAGGEGDDSTGVNPGGPGGAGGGAVALVAGGTITIPGAVYASGAGGGTIAGSTSLCAPPNGGFEQGAGGGGSGGMIVVEGASVMIPGKLAANGGGGGGGGACFGGAPGGDGTTMQWNARAVGGVGDTANGGANGGPGSAINLVTAMGGLSDVSGGGGGGGGLGVVRIGNLMAGGLMISPQPIPP